MFLYTTPSYLLKRIFFTDFNLLFPDLSNTEASNFNLIAISCYQTSGECLHRSWNNLQAVWQWLTRRLPVSKIHKQLSLQNIPSNNTYQGMKQPRDGAVQIVKGLLIQNLILKSIKKTCTSLQMIFPRLA